MGKALKKGFLDEYLDYYTVVHNFVYFRINDKDEVDDLCQEIFIEFYKQFDSIQNKRRWLLSVSKKQLSDYYKSRNNIDNIDDFDISFVNGFRDARIIIKDAIENIDCDEIDRNIFDLIAVSNFTYKKVGENFGLSIRQVEYRYKKTVQKILDYLQKSGIKEIVDLL